MSASYHHGLLSQGIHREVTVRRLAWAAGAVLPLVFPYAPFAQTASSSYASEVDCPSCDSTRPEVAIIRSAADLSHVDDPGKRVFCVRPGDYRSAGSVALSNSGTAMSPLYVVLDDAEGFRGTHPVNLPASGRGIIAGLSFSGASTIDTGRFRKEVP